MSPTTELILVLAVVATACAAGRSCCGDVARLRRHRSRAHLGIVLAYFVTRERESPWLMIGAALTGLLTVVLVELLQKTRLLKADAAIGLVFPALFALGVLLVSMNVRNVHLDVDAVLLGQPEMATVPRWTLFGLPIQPVWVMATVLALNIGLCALLFKELKLSTFDPGLASSLGFRPGLLHYGLMAVVSITAVAAFDAVGPVLVVAFFVVPAAAAFLLTDRLGIMIAIACGIGALGAWMGVVVAERMDANTAGAVATALGVLFAVAFLFAPGRGQVAIALRRREHRRNFEETMLAVHLYQHEGTLAEADEARVDGLHHHLEWKPERVATVVERAMSNGLVVRAGELLKLTESGRERAKAIFGGKSSADFTDDAD